MEERVQLLVEKGVVHVPEAYVRPPHERPGEYEEQIIPVIDLNQCRGRVVEEVGGACSEWGAFYVINHGVPLHTLDAMIGVGAQFLALPMEEKLQFACKPGIACEGYGSRMLATEDQVLDWRDYFDHHTLPISRRNPHRWPTTPAPYRKVIEEYSEEMKSLAQKLLAVISESLGLRSSYIEDAIGEPYQNVSLNYYPPCPEPQLTLGLQSHSDLGAITLLLQDEVGGLQVRKDGQWFSVKPICNSLVVNLADQIQILSNGRYKSVEHRAIVNKSKARISVATFYDPSKDRVISPVPELINKDHSPCYSSILYGDYVAAWYSKGPKGKKIVDSITLKAGF